MEKRKIRFDGLTLADFVGTRSFFWDGVSIYWLNNDTRPMCVRKDTKLLKSDFRGLFGVTLPRVTKEMKENGVGWFVKI